MALRPVRVARAAACAALLWLLAAGARAEPPRCDQLDAAGAQALLGEVEPALMRAQRGARVWFWGWLSVYGALTAVSAGLAALPGIEPVWRDANIASAASSGLALGLLLAPPLPTIGVRRRLGSTRGEARLARALALVRDAAAQERLLRSVWAQALNGSVALAQGLYLGLRYDGAGGVAAANALGAFAVGEAQILSLPRAAGRIEAALASRGEPCVARGSARAGVSLQLLVGPSAFGARLRF